MYNLFIKTHVNGNVVQRAREWRSNAICKCRTVRLESSFLVYSCNAVSLGLCNK